MLKFKCLECTPWPILYRNIFSFSTWKFFFLFVKQKKTLMNIFFLRFEQLKKMITKIGENRIRRFVVWYDELINEFLYIFSLNFQYEIRKYVLFSRVDRRASTDRMSLNQFKLVCLQFKSIFALHENDVCTRTYEFSNFPPLNIFLDIHYLSWGFLRITWLKCALGFFLQQAWKLSAIKGEPNLSILWGVRHL